MKNEKKKILVVDDIKENCEYLEILLGGNGYKVFSAENGKDALEKLNAHKFDLIISDILMPVMDGFELCRQAKKNETLKDIPFVFYTATYLTQKDEDFAYKLGVAKFLIKPLESKKILNIVKEIIENKDSFKCNPAPVPNEETAEVYKLYNERLIGKLEKKMLDLNKEISERKKIEEKLKKSEEKFRRIAENAKDIICRVSFPDGKYEYISPACFEVFGYAPREFYDNPKLIEQIIHPDFMEYFKNEWAKLLKGKMPPDYEYKIIDKSGKTKWLNQRNVAIKDKKGKLIAIEGIVTDITENKISEEKLIEEKEFSDAIINTSHAIIVGLDKNHKIKIFSRGAEIITGYSQEEVLEKDWFEIFFKPEMLKKMDRAWKEVWGIDFITYENPIFVKNGQEKIISWQITGFYKENDDNKHLMIAIGEDITDRKQAEKELIKSEEKFRTIADFTYGWEYWLNPQGEFIYVSPACERITGYNFKEFLQDSELLTKIVHPDDVNLFKNHKHKVFGTGEIDPIKFRIITKNKEIKWIDHVCQTVYDKNGESIGQRGSNRDITDRKKAEDKIRESEQFMISVFESVQDGISVLNPDLTIRHVNRTVKKWFKENLPFEGKKCYEVYHNADKPCNSCPTLRCLKSGQPERGIIPGLPGSSAEWFEVYSYPIKDPKSNQITGVVEYGRDITDREKAGEYLKKSEEKYRLISENSYDVIIYLINNKIIYISPALERLSGYKPNEFAENYLSYIHPDDVEAHKASVKYNIDSKIENAVRTERYRFKNGEYHWFENNIRNEYINDGTIITTVIARDITDRKNAEKKLLSRENYLVALNKAKEVLLISESENINAYQQFVDILGPASKASRTYIFLNHTGEKGEPLMSQKAEYCTKGIKPEIDNPALQNLKYDEFFKRQQEKLSKGELIFGKIKDFPKGEKEFLAVQDIKAVLIIPIVIDNNFIGFIGFDNCISESEWDEAEQNYLHSAAQDLAQFIIIKREKISLLEEHKRFETVMNSLDSGVYVADMQTHEILFANNHMKRLFGNDIIGKICWQTIHDNLTGPCDFCTNDKLLNKNGGPKKPYNWEFFNKKQNKWFAISDQAIKWIDDRIVRLEIATDITNHKLMEEKLVSRENYLVALNKAKEVLLISESENINAFQQFVDILGPASNASRTYIFLNHTNEKGENLISRKAEYYAPGISSQGDDFDLQNLNYDDFYKRWVKKFSKGESICGKIKDFPEEEKKALNGWGIKNIILFPIVVDKNSIGFIGFDNCISDREWGEAEQNYLHSAAQDLAQFIIIKREKISLLEEHKRFKTVMNSLESIVYVTDMQTYEILFVNNRSKQLYGKDIVGKICWKTFQENLTGPCVHCTNDKLVDENGRLKKNYTKEYFNDKNDKWYTITNEAIKWIDGRIVKLSIATDITEQKEAEKVIAQRHHMQSLLINSMPYPIMLINKKRKIVALNSTAKEMEVETNDYCWKEFGKCECISEENKILAKENPDAPGIKCTFCQADEMFDKNEIRNDPKVDAFGKIWDTYWVPLDDNLYLRYSIDVTERQKSAEKLDKYARTQEVLLREVNHRVKNNLYALMGMLYKEKSIFERKHEKNQSDFITDIIMRVDSLSTVHSLLSASKWQPLNLSELCRELIEHLVDSIVLDKIIKINITPSEVYINSDQAHNITLVLNEIITNAIKYALPEKEHLIIDVEIKSDDKNIFIKIKDNGKGLPQQLIEGDFDNTGIGFELIFGIVIESMGGDISVENNNGAIFNITFANKIV